MKTLEFKKSDKQFVIAQFNAWYHKNIDDVIALSVIERCSLCDKVFVFKTYENDNDSTYALYYSKSRKDIDFLVFESRNDAYKFILNII